MKSFIIWLLVTLGGFAGLGGATHAWLESHPKRVLVVVDSSYAMTGAWPRLPGILNRLDDAPYSAFSLATEKGLVHGWQGALRLGQLRPYAPRDFGKLAAGGAIPELSQADEVILITGAGDAELAGLPDWKILRP